MAPTRETRLLLLCGTSLLALQLIATPYDFAGPHRGLAPSTAAAQETSCFVAGTLVLMVMASSGRSRRCSRATTCSAGAAV